jgi:hypothetical protein
MITDLTNVPWRIRWHLIWTGHFLTHYNPHITVPMFDSSRGVLAKCQCRKVWAL